jgi:uncharacterized repeat protein (TIGR01451 family)
VLAVVAALAAFLAGGASAAVGVTDLTVSKADSADPVTDGNAFSYTITVRNIGPNDAAEVVVTDPLPSQVDYKSAATTAGTCSRSGATVNCELGTLPAGAEAIVTIGVAADRSGTASNTATVSTTSGDSDAASNADTETTAIAAKPPTPKKPKKPKASARSCATPTILGTPGNDSITGTSRGDVIVTFGGNDSVDGGRGDDIICLGSGGDTATGGSGRDFISAGGGRDVIFGSLDNDVLKGKRGRDRIFGNQGDDFLGGGRGNDRCRGGPGRDATRNC